jgi:GT2 family glycosyltransferase
MPARINENATGAGLSAASGVAITAIVTAFQRIEQTCSTIAKIRATNPAPDEILVHVDANQLACASAIRDAFPGIKVMVSAESVGPGGGRNKLIEAARNELVASFDDDSYPADPDFFWRAATLFERFPEAALIGCSIFHRGEAVPSAEMAIGAAGSFVGCGVVYRRSDFIEAGGYVPLPLAYGMEEEDLALRLLSRGKLLLYSPWLRVYHDTDLSHHGDPKITAAQIANGALLAFLRYPKRHWPYGAAQVINRVLWSLKNGRRSGVASGLAQIPGHLLRHRKLRQPVSQDALKAKLKARMLSLQGFTLDERSPALATTAAAP